MHSADCLCLTVPEKEMTEQVLLMDALNDMLVDAALIKCWTAIDVILSHVYKYISKDWPAHVEDHFKPYQHKKTEV